MAKSLKYNKQQRGYITIYIPFKTELKEDKKSIGIKRINPKTKLIIKTVSQTLNENVANYCLYNAPESVDEKKEFLDIKKRSPMVSLPKTIIEDIAIDHIGEEKEKVIKAIKLMEDKIQNYIGSCNKIEKTITTKKDVDITIDNICFSIYNDCLKNIGKTGVLKVRVKIQFLKDLNIKNKVQAIRDVYHVFSRNIKNKKETSIDFGFNFDDVTNLFNKFKITFVDNKTYELKIKEDDWLFNYNKNDRRSYSFAYITHDEKITDYNNEKEKKNALYNLSRIHENGIRTYNKINDIYDFYEDDTSVIWGVSRIGLGALCVQKDRIEFYRNIDVLNNDFSDMYEFSLHQKFFNYLIANTNNKVNNSLLSDSIVQKEGLAQYKNVFCPNIISEFENQNLYELIINKLEINKLFKDAETNIEKLEANKEHKKNTAFVVISFIAFGLLFPSAFFTYIDSSLGIINNNLIGTFPQFSLLLRAIIYLCFVAVGCLLSLIYYKFTGKTKK